MKPPPANRSRHRSIAVALLLALTMLGPGIVDAAGDLLPGSSAVIAEANGDLVRLRSKPGPEGTILNSFPEGTVVDIVDGPLAGSDGAPWYQVRVAGQTGYMTGLYLSLPGAAPLPKTTPTPEATPAPTAPAVTVTLVIVNTNGDDIRCRAAPATTAKILTNFREGDLVETTGDRQGGWQPVRCAGASGWVFADYLGVPGATTPAPTATSAPQPKTPTPTPAPEATDAGVGGFTTAALATAAVTGTNGLGLRCRAAASFDGAVIAVLPDGTIVNLRGSQQGDWQPVVCAGKNGFVHADYLGPASGGDGGGNTGDAGSAGVGVIRGTNGDGVRCRSAASTSASVITVVMEGTEVALRGARSGVWQPVVCAGQSGWVHTDYIVPAGTGGDTGGDSGGNPPSNSSLQAGDTAAVTGTNGDGVRLRSKPSTSGSIITVVAEGKQVAVRAGSTGDWVAVSYRGSDGFIHMDYLKQVSTDTGGDTGGNTGGDTGGGLARGDHAMVNDTVNFRGGPSLDAKVITIALPSTVVEITGAKSGDFYPVRWDDLSGYLHGAYLVRTAAPLTTRVTPVAGDAGSAPGTAQGVAMVSYAKKYLGYPYIWATHGPSSFDCSGFTYWVVKNVLKQDIGAGTWSQWAVGRPVLYGDLQPGDLVFFQNTYTVGLSHVGIYIGNNQFIHAENEETGVRISDLTSPYYATRWFGARRLI